MEYCNGRLCISTHELFDGGIVSESNYRNWTNRNRVEVVRRGGGARGSLALIAVDSLPQRAREKVETIYPGGAQARLEGWVKSNYEVDQAAVAYFFSKEKCGVALPSDKAQEYITNASVLNTCIKLYERASTAQKLFGGKYDWSMMSATIEALRKHFGHTLPASTLRFRKKVNDYKVNGYACLVSGKFGNQSARKVNYKTERLIRGIAVLPHKPWNTNVLELYNSFVTGELDVYDPESGVLFNPEDFTDKNGEPFTIYYFKDDDLPFAPNDYELGGKVKRVSFQEGCELGGLGNEEDGTYYFEVNFNSDTHEFEIITIWPYDDDTQLPGGRLIPAVGDGYILWNLSMPDEYYRLADAECRAVYLIT